MEIFLKKSRFHAETHEEVKFWCASAPTAPSSPSVPVRGDGNEPALTLKEENNIVFLELFSFLIKCSLCIP